MIEISSDESSQSEQSEDDLNEAEEEEDYTDPNVIEAGSVLKEADALSIRVLRTMVSFMRNRYNVGGGGGSIPEGMIVDGALALSALGNDDSSHFKNNKTNTNKNGDGNDDTNNMNNGSNPNNNSSKSNTNNNNSSTTMNNDNNPNNKQQPEWITHEKIATICQTLKLAEYQLVGINWMALLHSMKCRLDGGNSSGSGSVSKGGGGGTSVNGVLADEMGLGKTGK